jgi:threonine/homoserine/homoserine lactone efflux protein
MLDLATILVFAGALFVAAASPGPGIAAIVARVLGRGTRGAIAFTIGVAIGDVVWLTFTIGGLAALASAFNGLFLAIKYAGAAYLLYLAYRLWTASAAPSEVSPAPPAERPMRLFLGGLAVTMGNPKVMVFYLALVPNLVDLGAISPLGYAELALVTQLVLAVVFAAYIALADRARLLFRSRRAMLIVNRGSGCVMAGAAVAVATR